MAVWRLISDNDRRAYADHIRRLSVDDRRLRFGGAVSPAYVDQYLDRISPADDLLGIVREGIVIGAVHIGYMEREGSVREAEIGFSVDADRRGHGLGKKLFGSALLHCRNRNISHVYTYCVRDNIAVQKIVKSFGFSLQYDGPESEARLSLPLMTTSSLQEEAQLLRDEMTERLLGAQG